MFEYIDEKIKTIAKILFYTAAICFIVWGISYFFKEPYRDLLTREKVTKFDLIVKGIIIAIFGTLGSYISSLIMYGFGELISNTKQIKSNNQTKNQIIVERPSINENNNYNNEQTNNSNKYIHTFCEECGSKLTFSENSLKGCSTVKCHICNHEIDVNDIT